MRFMSSFYWILQLREYLEKMNNFPKHNGVGPKAAASA